MRKLLLSIFLLFSVAIAGAQEQTEAATENNAATAEVDGDQAGSAADEQSTGAEQQAATEQGSADSNGKFIPSEEISEDLPVSFPVDI